MYIYIYIHICIYIYRERKRERELDQFNGEASPASPGRRASSTCPWRSPRLQYSHYNMLYTIHYTILYSITIHNIHYTVL